MSQPTVVERVKELSDLAEWPNPVKVAALYQEEIAAALSWSQDRVSDRARALRDLADPPNPDKVAALYQDGFEVPLYNVWSFAALSNETKHFGNSDQRIVDRLLYLYTEPFDVVVDPFAGGGGCGPCGRGPRGAVAKRTV